MAETRCDLSDKREELLGYARTLVPVQNAEDLVQDVLLYAWETCVKDVYAYMRRRAKAHREEAAKVRQYEDVYTANPEEQMLLHERTEALAKRLTDREFAAIQLKHRGLSQRKIAEAMDVSQSTVSRLLQQARRKW